jgi:hypothetical protein
MSGKNNIFLAIIKEFGSKKTEIRRIKIILIFFRACPLASLGVGLRLQVRGHKPWGRKAAKRAYKLAFLPPRPQRLPPLRAFRLRPHAA